MVTTYKYCFEKQMSKWDERLDSIEWNIIMVRTLELGAASWARLSLLLFSPYRCHSILRFLVYMSQALLFWESRLCPLLWLEKHVWGSTLQQWAFWCGFMSACMFILWDCWVLREGPWESILITPLDRAPPSQYLCPTCLLNSVDSGPAYCCRGLL